MAQAIDEALVRHVGKLSRIALSDAEVALFGAQLAEILAYVDKLQQLDTTDVEPMAHALEMRNVLQEDRLHESLSAEQALANAPDRHDDLFQVPKVLGDSQ